MQDVSEDEKCSRPIGTKRAKQREDEGTLIKAVMREVGVEGVGNDGSKTGVCGGSIDRVVGVVESIGNSVINYWRDQNESAFIETLPTPEKNEWKKEQFAIRLTEARLKRRKLC